MPAHLRPEMPSAAKPAGTVEIDASWFSIIMHWRLVLADLSLHCGVDLYDPAVLARPWPGIRTMIFSLLDSPTRLRAVLTRR